LWHCYRTLLALRRQYPVLGVEGKRRLAVRADGDQVLTVLRRDPGGATALGALNFSREPQSITLKLPSGPWRRVLDTGEERFGGPGPRTPALFSVARSDRTRLDVGPFHAAIFLRTDAVPVEAGTTLETI